MSGSEFQPAAKSSSAESSVDALCTPTEKVTERPAGVRRVVVVGGGISGLTAAYRLASAPPSSGTLEVFLCEGGSRLGGTIGTYKLDETILELGPDAFITNKPAGLELVEDLNLSHRLIPTDEKHRRSFIARNNRLFPLPEGFFMMAPTKLLPTITSDLFSWAGKLRLVKELFIPPAPPDSDETLSQFVERRLGKEALERVVQPLVGGIYTADPDKLSVKAALPQIVQLEQQYGSLIRGMTATRSKGKGEGESGARYSLFVTFDEGMQVLVNALENALPAGCIRFNAMVTAVTCSQGSAKLQVTFSDGSIVEADGVVIATPSFQSAQMLSSVDPELASHLQKIEYSSSLVLNMIYRREDIQHPLDGFGFVVPRTEKRTILACSFSSVKFPQRSQGNRVVLRAFVGGALQPELFDLSDEQIECLVWEDLHTYLGISPIPTLSVISRYPKSMPQYNVGHKQLVEKIEGAVDNIGGLALAGNAYHGVGIPDCIASGNRAAARIIEHCRLLDPGNA